ncbi:MAG: S9 family peptidase [Acidobacteria bacterium]|nr:MAG: S9 family peptidase [Acidobacteriota bacterium]REK00891.1 MAG: S9 family peptidase [Acidobacteriota bacterium]
MHRPERLVCFLLAALLIGLLVGCGGEMSPDNDSATATGPAPLIDRELFFGDPEVSGADLSPDGEWISFLKPYEGIRNIWVKRRDEPFADARPLTADARPVSSYFWSRDGEAILYVQDKGGDENYHVWAVDPAADADPATGVPKSRDLTPIDGVRAAIYAVPRSQPDVIYVGLNDRDPSLHDVYRVRLEDGSRELVRRNDEGVTGWTFDLDGKLRLGTRQTADGGTEVLRIDEDGVEPIFSVGVSEQVGVWRFLPGGERAYVVTNHGDDRDLAALHTLDPESGAIDLVEEDPEGEVDFGGALFDQRSEELIATVYLGDRQRVYVKDEELERDLERLRAQLPDGELSFAASTDDMRLHLVGVTRDVDPGSMYLYDRESGQAELLYRSRPDLPSEHLAEMRPIRYTARDGLEIPAYLTLPRGLPEQGLPLVVHPHGGPWARDAWGYDPYAQFLANRGYAVLQPNFRSSTGYGKAFFNAGDRTWGTGAMQHDITDGVRHLIEQGIVDAERVCIFGGSYGGYATLAGVTFTPDLYACGIPYVAPSSLITLIESFPAYWRPMLKGTWYHRVGDPAVEADRRDLEARSPLNYIDQIEVPLLVVHGANDPRVKQQESDQIVAALHGKGHAVTYVVAPDEGHGFQEAQNRKALAVAIERFLAEQLGGRMQEDVPEETAARLAAITVDPASVAGAAKAEDAS